MNPVTIQRRDREKIECGVLDDRVLGEDEKISNSELDMEKYIHVL